MQLKTSGSLFALTGCLPTDQNYEFAGGTGPMGSTGATGAVGPVGAAFHLDFTNETIVTFNHNLGHYPIVQVFDPIIGIITPVSIVNTSVNQVVITFTNPTSGVVVASYGSGTPGETGPAGPQGIQGPIGSSTAVIAGPTGADGLQGPQGSIGPQGNQGGIGPIGLTGGQGAQGDYGPTGIPGPQGNQGDFGPQGPQGFQGPIGSSTAVVAGPQGPQGAPGSSTAVSTGPPGPQGAAGSQGPAGVDGATGPAGGAGSAGPTGPAGVASASTLLTGISLTAGGWSLVSGIYQYTYSNVVIHSTSFITVVPLNATVQIAITAEMLPYVAVAEGSCIIYCTYLPVNAISVNIIIGS